METTVCPTRLLADEPDVSTVVEWFLWSMDRDGWSGSVRGIKDWPRAGGVMCQDAQLVRAAALLINEWPFLPMNAAPAARPN